MRNIVFDSHAILRFSQDEAGAEKVELLLNDAHEGRLRAYMSEINLGEVYYVVIRRMGIDSAREFLEHLSVLPIQRVPASWEIVARASEVKAEHALSYADCFAVATALKYDASIVTGDPEFRNVETLVAVDWI